MTSRLLAALALASAVAMTSCSVNDYCLDCLVGDGGPGDGSGGDDGSGSGTGDGGDCVPTGPEICNDLDDDCDGQVDNAPVQDVGLPCSNQMGACAGGVQVCVGGQLRCDKMAGPERCNMVDDNCNGMTDEGNPEGGGTCGTDMGECVAGTEVCNATTGALDCLGFVDRRSDPELCDGKDNDCDGQFDEGVGSLGSCGPSTSEGECNIGTLMCQGGAGVCMNAVFPRFESCNNLDDDCDAAIDENFNKQTDPKNCGVCGNVCPAQPNANIHCASSTCGYTCRAGYHDLTAAPGCEYGPCFISGTEECDGADNDCDGQTDEGLTPPPICVQGGECGTAVPTCGGAAGWTCTYGSTVQFPETRCDGLDNDCDTRVDEGQPNLGQACDDGRQGVCKGTGSFTCDTASPAGPAVCTITMPGQAIPDPAESCNGKDDDCDGTTDEAALDNFVPVTDAMNNVIVRVYTYEASRPDASATSPGTMSHRACSRGGVLPWASVTQTQAAAACAAVDPAKNSRLCSAADWQRACEGTAQLRYPYGNTYDEDACNGNDYDPDCTLPDDDTALPAGTPYGCPTKPATSACVSPAGALDMSGNLKEWTSTQVAPGAFNIRGGAYDSVAGGLTCRFDFVSATSTFSFANLGFRCCADP